MAEYNTALQVLFSSTSMGLYQGIIMKYLSMHYADTSQITDSIENFYAKNKYRAEMSTFLKSITRRKIDANFKNVKANAIFIHISNKTFCSICKT